MNVPFTAVQFVVYESGKRALVASHLLDSTDEEGLMEQLLAGGAAGGAAAAITNPLDIAKTRLQTAGVWEPAPVVAPPGGGAAAPPPRPPSSATRVFPVLREILAKEGWSALARGIGPRVLFHVPVRHALRRTWRACAHPMRPDACCDTGASDVALCVALCAGGCDLLGDVRDGEEHAAAHERGARVSACQLARCAAPRG
jgi:hypothetical protein